MTEENKTGDIVPVRHLSEVELRTAGGNPLARLAADILGTEAHNYDLNNPDEFMAYAVAISTPPEKLADGLVTDFDIVYYYCKQVEFVDPKSAEVTVRPLTIIQSSKGELFSSTSPGVFRTVLALGMRKDGNRKFDPPIKVRLNKVPSKHPTPTFLLSVISPGKK